MGSVNNIDEDLFYSSFCGDLDGVVNALAQGGRVAVRIQGGSPLTVAARKGHTDICGLLLAHSQKLSNCQKVKCLVCMLVS